MGAILKYFYDLGKELGEKWFGQRKEASLEENKLVEKKQCNAINVEEQD